MTLYYFDHAASAPRRPEVLEAMAPYLTGVVGNPSGTHRAARAARKAIEEARDEIAQFVGVEPAGVVLTAGGTESCHLALTGTVRAHRRAHRHSTVIVSAIEHHAVLEAAHALEFSLPGVSVTVAPVDADGVIDLAALEESCDESTALVSVMTANNETGVIEPVNAIATVVRERAPDAVTHTDAIAAAPFLDLRKVTSDVDLISICAHKLGGPVNAGALCMRRPVGLDPVVVGGGQERGRRGGTVDVAAAVGLAAAVRATANERDAATTHCRALQRQLISCATSIAGVAVTADAAARLPGHVHLTVSGAASDELLFLLDQRGVCASAASSCASGATVGSHVLAAMGVPSERARGAVRFTIGAETTAGDVTAVSHALSEVVAELRR